ncbi:hypothetical protein B0H17DRAFT_1058751 [Mycena rosella]|uniref:Uncharacterized protein n=1 Tax=Mycena rosella TaxID=1033263 RepID=A0AAD7DMT1_MYCRO|nr:hypothetical protein B0H17DRAFT_1058751 [Mycena rosella]
MGRWTSEYTDDVLSSKLKGLVSGAIKRSKLEKAEPTISYKNFVEDLDAGDSFTTAVIDILVQELAERRLRSSPGDRRLIADSTAKSLRLLATPIRIYHGRRSTARRTGLTEYLTAPLDEMDMEEDEDEFDTLLERGPVEGVRISSELYDAYNTSSWTSASTARRSFPASPPTPTRSEDSPTPPMLSPPTSIRGSVWSLPPAAPGSLALARQPSLRRPARSRTVDFNEFTSRRRSSTREPATTAADEPWSRAAQSTRRFFPFSYQTRRHDLRWNDGAELADEPLAYTEPATFYSFPTPASSNASTQDPAETSEERGTAAGAPRLRRGGVRSPESLLLRRVSPAFNAAAPQSPVSEAGVDAGVNSAGVDAGVDSVGGADAAAYPTPTPADNEDQA